ncbi:MAG: hypothetical protein K940chlam5_01492 [Candidatus Anoxychlamydiales bacterium]|nr:hypothetical protein [Candidatus Anoxychlamydiales bacterium]
MLSLLKSFVTNNIEASKPNNEVVTTLEDSEIQTIIFGIFFSESPLESLKKLKKPTITVTDYIKIEILLNEALRLQQIARSSISK